MQLDKIAKTPNTLAAHRLIFWAWQEGLQSALISSLFRAYFIKGEDIGKKHVLINLSKDSGLDEALITRLLEGKMIVNTSLNLINLLEEWELTQYQLLL